MAMDVLAILDAKTFEVIRRVQMERVLPHSICVRNDTVFVTEYLGRRISKYTIDGDFIAHAFPRNPAWPDWILNGPTSTCIDVDSNFYVCDFDSNSVQKFSPTGEFCGVLAKSDSIPDTSSWMTDLSKSPDRSFRQGQFDHPNDIALDREGNLYVVDMGNHRIQKFSRSGNFLGWLGSIRKDRSFKSLQHFELNGDSQLGISPGSFATPSAISIHDQEIVVAGHLTSRLQKFSLDGNFLGWLGGRSWNTALDDWSTQKLPSCPGNALGMFFLPYGVHLSDHRLLVADTYNERIQIFDF